MEVHRGASLEWEHKVTEARETRRKAGKIGGREEKGEIQ